jgi:hypothetical protein
MTCPDFADEPPVKVRCGLVLTPDQATALWRLHARVAPPKTPFKMWLEEAMEDAAFGALMTMVRQQMTAEELARLEASGQVDIGRSEQDISTSGVWSSTDGEAA